MTRAEDLEADLLAHWDLATLEVYGDSLQALGDPRGELIATELAIGKQGKTPALLALRSHALRAWLGDETICGRPWHARAFAFGFLDDFVASSDLAPIETCLEALFASPAGPVVRGLTVQVANAREAGAALAVIARAPRPWLERLELRTVHARTTVAPSIIDDVIRATPRLRTLALYGDRVIEAFAHPVLRRLELDVALLSIVEPALPAITELALSMVDGEDDVPAEHVLAGYLGAACLPGLRHLDLSANEPVYPASDPPNVDVFPLARALPLAGRVRELRLPSLRAPGQVEVVRDLLARAPELEIWIARSYQSHAHLAGALVEPRVHVPAPCAWPARDQLSSREALTIELPGELHGEDISLTTCVELLEAQFARLPPDAQAAWTELWRFVTALGWEDPEGRLIERAFPAATLVAAIDALDDVDPRTGALGHWGQLGAKLHATSLPPDTTVRIRRYWGW